MHSLLRVGVLLLITSVGAQSEPTAAPRQVPNIVVLLADDAGYADFGFQAESTADVGVLTPNIDSIARSGARFTNAYMAGSVCSPSRAGLLIGRYQQRFGHETNIPPGYMRGGLPLDQITLADRLRAEKLQTGLVGKWHLGYPEAYQPNQRGFDWFFGLLQGARSYLPIHPPRPHQVIQENGTPLPEMGYVTDRFGSAAARFIERHTDRPFFLLVSFTAPHGPLQPRPEDLELEELRSIEKPARRNYAGLIKALDDNVGSILDALREHELEDRTLVVFTNDNGGQTGTGAVNRPLRGRKGQLWEGGIRVPMAMRWPGQIEPGLTIEDPVISLDLLPTFLEVVGSQADPDWELDGVNLVPRITQRVESLPERSLYWRSHGKTGPAAMRRGNLKLVVERGPRHPRSNAQLFDLSEDPGESTDLAADRIKDVERLQDELAQWESELIEPLWGKREPRRRRN